LPGRQAIAVTDGSGGMSLEMYPFPCPEATKSPPPRLEGPGAEISGLLFSTYSDCLLATSGTALFSWSWPQEAKRPSEARFGASPLRPVQGSVVYDTPDGQKRALAASPASKQRPRSAGSLVAREKENDRLGKASEAMQTPPPKKDMKRHVGPSPAEQAIRTPPPPKRADSRPRPVTAWAEAAPTSSKGCERMESPASVGPSTGSNAAAAGSEGLGKPKDTEQWIIESKAPAGLPSRRKSSDVIASKIGAAHEQKRNPRQVASDTKRHYEDNEARSRSIQERHTFDSVGLLLSGKAQPNVAGVDRLEETYQQSRAGKFQYRAHEAADRFEVEAHLPGGKLLRVTRNPLRRTLCFEGKAVSLGPLAAEDEHLLVRVPPGFDVVSAPAEVLKDFEKGRCWVALHRNGLGGRSDRSGAGVTSAEVSDL